MNKDYALKILRPDMIENAKVLVRFDSEAKVLGKIGNPHVIGVHNYGISESDAPYLVMDLVKGISLEDEIEQNRFLPESRAIAIFSQVCDDLVRHTSGVLCTGI